MKKILAGICIALALAAWWFYDDARDAGQRLATAECQRDTAVDANRGNEQVRRRQHAADAERIAALEAEIERLQTEARAARERAARFARQRDAVREDFHALRQQNRTVDDWARTPVPGAVLERLRRNPADHQNRAGGGGEMAGEGDRPGQSGALPDT